MTAAAAYVLTIAGAPQKFQLHSLQITETANGRNTARANILSTAGTYRPPLDADFVITENGARIFGGTVDASSERGIGGLGLTPIVTAITAVEYGGLAERQHVAAPVPAGSLKAFLTAMLPYLPGVTLDAAQVTGPALPLVPYASDKVVRDALTEACGLAGGYLWEIDYAKVLRAYPPGTRTAPFNIADGDRLIIGDVSVEPQRTTGQYANRVIVQAGTGTARIIQNWTGDGVTTKWITDIPATNDWPGTYHMHGADNPLGPYEPGNAASLWPVQWDAATHALYNRAGDPPFAAGDPFSLAYIAQYPYTVIVEDLAEQALHGIWDLPVALPDVFTRADAIAYGQAYLTTATVVPKKVTYTTEALGLRPGMMQILDLPSRNLNGSYLITDITTANIRDRSMARTVTLIEGSVYRGSPANALFQQWSGTGAVSTVAAAGGSSGSSSGGSSGGGRQAPYFLGGSGLEGRRTATAGDWVPVAGGQALGAGSYQVQLDTVARGSNTAIVVCRLRCATAGPSVVARLYNVSDSLACASVSVAVTGTAWRTVVFAVSLTPGTKFYELQVQPSLAGADVFGVGYVE
jgi:hypothetical protein